MFALVHTYLLIIVYNVLLSKCVTVSTVYEDLEPLCESKIELTPLVIPGGLEDIIIISAPILHTSTRYYLSNPEGETTLLNITANVSNSYRQKGEFEEILVKFTRGEIKAIITPANRYKIFNVNFGDSFRDPSDTYGDETKDLLPNDFIIGPINEVDHGNWVLSAYVKKRDGAWVEVFQVITIRITESIPTNPTKPKLRPGETFDLSFAYPIKALESCEITAPRSTFDRFYDRSSTNLDSCGFRVTNVTKADEGLWRIIGVGRIVYESTVYLEVNDVS